MNQPKVQPFYSNITDSTSYNSSNNNNRHSVTSPPMAASPPGPVQVEGGGTGSGPSSLVNGNVCDSVTSKVSFLVPKKKESMANNDPLPSNFASSMPKLEAAGSLEFLSELENEQEPGFVPGSPSASLYIPSSQRVEGQPRNATSLTSLRHDAGNQQLPPPTAPVLDITAQNPCSFKSREVRVTLRASKLFQSGRKGHTWNDAIPVEVSKKKEVKVRLFIFPRVSNGDNTQTTKLDVTAQVSRKLLKKLLELDKVCYIKVESEVLDTHAGQIIGSTRFRCHAVSMEDGRVNFRQDLVPCDKVRECGSDSVTIVFKVTFSTQERNEYKIKEDGGFLVVDAAPTPGRH